MWTPQQRDEWVMRAKTSKDVRHGMSSTFTFKKYPRQNTQVGPSVYEEKASAMTQMLSDIIYNDPDNPVFRKLPLHVYRSLLDKITDNPFLNFYYYFGYIHVMVKGSNAYAYLMNMEEFRKDFPFSDLDIVVAIDPKLEHSVFEKIRDQLKLVIFQVISLHKKTLDHMFFFAQSNPAIRGILMEDTDIDKFKRAYQDAIGHTQTIFNDKEMRNVASRYSFVMTDCEDDVDHVVKIEVPHFHGCNKIPLHLTPVFCSYNNCINTMTPDYTHHFDLFRIKLNNVHVEDNGGMDNPPPSAKPPRIKLGLGVREDDTVCATFDYVFPKVKQHYTTCASDLVDISLLHHDDTELVKLWESKELWSITDPCTGIELYVPHINELTRDLENMIYVYDCPDSKRDKRWRKYQIMKLVCDEYNKSIAQSKKC